MPLIPELGRQRQEDFFNSRPAWSTEGAPGQPGIHRETQSSKKPQKKKKKTKNQKTKQKNKKKTKKNKKNKKKEKQIKNKERKKERKKATKKETNKERNEARKQGSKEERKIITLWTFWASCGVFFVYLFVLSFFVCLFVFNFIVFDTSFVEFLEECFGGIFFFLVFNILVYF